MMIFISYNSGDFDRVQALAGQFGILGTDIRFEQKMPGGNVTWHDVFDSIENCDVFVFAASKRSLESRSEAIEYHYASKMGRPILTVMLEPISSENLPLELTVNPPLNFPRGYTDLRVLYDALKHIPSPGDPLYPFAISRDFRTSLRQLRDEMKVLPADVSAQWTLFYQLREFLERSETFSDAQRLLQRLESHPSLSKDVRREINKTFRQIQQMRTRRLAAQRRQQIFKGAALLIAIPVLLLLVVRAVQVIPSMLSNGAYPTPSLTSADSAQTAPNQQTMVISAVTNEVSSDTIQPASNELLIATATAVPAAEGDDSRSKPISLETHANG